MAEAPTKEGQNTIIKNLNNIFFGVVTILIGALFAWGQGINRENGANKVIIQELRDENHILQNQIDDVEEDVRQLVVKAEAMHDDSKIRITKVEDWQLAFDKYNKLK